MEMFQYGIAFLAIAVAVLLAAVRWTRGPTA